MSLLLDALKKAEEAKRRREAGLSGTAPATPEPAAAAVPTASEPSPVPLVVPEPVSHEPELTLAPVEARPVEPEPEVTAAPAEAELPVLELEEVSAAAPAPAEVPASDDAADVASTEEAVPPLIAPPVVEIAVEPPTFNPPEPEPVATPTPAPAPEPEPLPVAEPARRTLPTAAPAEPAIRLESRRESPMQLSPEATRQLFDSQQGGKAARARRNRIALLVGLCLAVAFAGAGWLWWQWQRLNQPGMLVSTSTSAVPAATNPAADGEPTEGALDGVAPPAEIPASTPTVSPATQASTPRPANIAPAEIAPPPKPALPVTPQAGDRARVVEIPANVAAPDVRFVRDAQDPGVPRLLQQAYDAFQQGDHGRAAELYRQHLRQDGKSRDALLGLAAVAVQRQQFDEARNLYRRVLADNPRDDIAQSALTSLSTGSDPDAAEGKLRTLMQSSPRHETATSLANLLAGQGRWSEAQEFYFQAFSSAPDEPDYAYNLAIALDALGERKLAADHYRKALTLSSRKPAAFSAEAVRRRLSQLGGE